MKPLSKSDLLAFRQCPKRLWLEIHKPKRKVLTDQAKARQVRGELMGTHARFLYDPDEVGYSLEQEILEWGHNFDLTNWLLEFSIPLFDASFRANLDVGDTMCKIDVLLPMRDGKRRVWHIVEVKSSTSVQPHHRDDVAYQAYVAKAAGLPLQSVAVAHVDSRWKYRTFGDFRGLLVEEDLTQEANARSAEVEQWIEEAQSVTRQRKAPKISPGAHCQQPHECGFLKHCMGEQAQPTYPVQWLPRVQSAALKTHLSTLPSQDMRDVRNGLLNPLQRRVKACTLSGEAYWDSEGAVATLKRLGVHKPPLYFLDIESVQMAEPRWIGTRPYQQIPFQFSCHYLSRSGRLRHTAFLDLSGDDPSLPLAEALLEACGKTGAILAYNADFEKSRIRELAKRYPTLKAPLLDLVDRLVDLLSVARQHYYHPDMQGSWSIKKILPCLVPSLSYDAVPGVKNEGDAVAAYLEAIDPFNFNADIEAIRGQMLEYCGVDTFAMVKLWQVFAGRSDMELM